MRKRSPFLVLALAVVSLLPASTAHADRLCDPAAEDCRTPLLNLIRAERTGIDVAFWFMEDARFSAELIRRAQAGVPVRVLVDTTANLTHPVNAQIVNQLRSAGIPMRRRNASSILHWKVMIFAGQGQVEFSGANYSPDAFVPTEPYRNYVDEAIFFTSDPAIVHSFMRRFDDLWVDTTTFIDDANVTSRARHYALFPFAPELNFPPLESYRQRAVAAYNAEPAGIDAIMYRITDRGHSDALIAAARRGVRVRVITEQFEYRNRARLLDAWNVDRLWMAGIEVRQRAHAGLNHQKSVILRGLKGVIFGSSNWTASSDQSQEEHNFFTTRSWILDWFEAQFDRKWNNTGPSVETQSFQPQPPDAPSYAAPANGAVGVATGPVLTFRSGPFAHLYDIYVGTTSSPPLVAVDVPLGPSEGEWLSYQLPPLAPGTRYFWRVVAKTMALQPAGGPVWSFTTAGRPGPAPAPLPSPAPTPTPDPGPAPFPTQGPPPAPEPPPPPAPPQPAMSIDLPRPGSVVRQPFVITGWAVDLAAADNGIDVVHAYLYPAGGAPPIFVGAAAVAGARPDVGALFGAQHTPSGYGLIARGLPPGAYTLAVFAHSSRGAGFVLTRVVAIRVEASPAIRIDGPRPGAVVGQRFGVGGWAADFSAASGGGIDLVHVYAYPLDAAGQIGAPVFLGQAIVNVARPDVAAAFGAQFGQTGYNIVAPPLPPGRYRVVAFGRSLVSGTFAAVDSADVLVR